MEKRDLILQNPFLELQNLLQSDNIFLDFSIPDANKGTVTQVRILDDNYEPLAIIYNSFESLEDALDFLLEVKESS